MNLYQAVLQAKVVGVGAELHFARAEITTSTGALEELLRRLSGINSGLVLSVDEAQSVSSGDFTQLAALFQRSVRLEAPLVSLIGGLPTLRSMRAGSPDSLGYLERADWHELAALDGKARRYALQETARLSGRSMTSEAANRLLELAGGYPYAIQVVGRHAWRASQNSRTIEIDHADAALAPAAAEFARTLYSRRWAQTSRTERQYQPRPSTT